MIERIKEVKKVYRLTNKMIADESGVSINTVTKQLQGLYKVDIDVMAAIVRLADGVDATWLLTGNSKTEDSIEKRITRLERAVFGENL